MREFYARLTELERRIGGRRRLAHASGRMGWPERGVYFLFEPGERRSRSGVGSRVVHIGTHALTPGSQSTLWGRLRQHRGTVNPLGGNHRASDLRTFVGDALMVRSPHLEVSTRGKGRGRARHSECRVEELVSRRIREMRVVFLPIDDAAGPDSLRGYIERNSIALLSVYARACFDPPSTQWLGRFCGRGRIWLSGLWNDEHVDKTVDGRFVDLLGHLVRDCPSFARRPTSA